jgi:hypothetical protein
VDLVSHSAELIEGHDAFSLQHTPNVGRQIQTFDWSLTVLMETVRQLLTPISSKFTRPHVRISGCEA